MSIDTKTQDTVKIKMDSYSKQLYEDFVQQLANTLRGQSNDTQVTLNELIESINTLPHSVDEELRQSFEPINRLLTQLPDTIVSIEKTIKDEICIVLNQKSSEIIADASKNNNIALESIDNVIANFAEIRTLINDPENALQSGMSSNLTTAQRQLQESLSEYIKGLYDGLINHFVTDLSTLKEEILTLENTGISDIINFVEDQSKQIISVISQENTKSIVRLKKISTFTSRYIKRIIFTNYLLKNTLDSLAQDCSRNQTIIDNRLIEIMSLTSKLHRLSEDISESSQSVLQNSRALKDYIVTETYPSLTSMIDSLSSHFESLLHNDRSELFRIICEQFLQVALDKTQEIVLNITRIIDSCKYHLSELIDGSTRDTNAQTLKSQELIREEIKDDILTTEKVISGKTDGILNELGELSNAVQNLSASLELLLQEQQDSGKRLIEQLNINQELIIWMLKPWYKKIFRGNNGKPQILIKQNTVE